MLPNQASRNSFKYRNSLTRSLTSSREKLVLLSEHQMKRYPIFLDKEIGIPDTYQNTIQDIVLMLLDREETRTMTVLTRS